MEDNLMDMIISDESPSNISDKIKDILYAKSAEKIDGVKSSVAAATFGSDQEAVDQAVSDAADVISGADKTPEASDAE
jgi:hypothetical protein